MAKLETINKLVLDKDDLLVVTIGNLEHNIMPTTKDLKTWRKLLNEFVKTKFKGQILVIPPVCKFEVFKASSQGDK